MAVGAGSAVGEHVAYDQRLCTNALEDPPRGWASAAGVGQGRAGGSPVQPRPPARERPAVGGRAPRASPSEVRL